MPTLTYVEPTDILLIAPPVGGTLGGDFVSVIGAGFRPGATVTFGGSSATLVYVVAHDEIICKIPAHAAGLVDIVVTNTTTFLNTATLVGGFLYYAAPPLILSVTLDYGDTTGGDTGVIRGYDFDPAATVKFDTDSATSVVVVDPTTITYRTPAHAAGIVDVKVTNPDTQYDSFIGGFEYLSGSPFSDTRGWWTSTEKFAGGGTELVITNYLTSITSNPQHGRAWDKVAAFATGSSGMLGGSPAASVMFNQHMIYAGDNYTLGTTEPTIRVFDGQADRMMASIPPTTSGAVPKAIISMLIQGDLIYISTLDSGTTAADFAGRVFEFDPNAASLKVVGDNVFTTGHVPYALGWHMGRLWVGTNKGDGTAGKIYFIRPNIDTAWTQDYNLATSTVGGATALRSYKGLLYVGTDNAAAAFAQVLVRAIDATYSTSLTATGGTARKNNGFLSFSEFLGNLYAGYWNPDTTPVAKVYKFDNTSWSTAYTGATTTLRPYILQVVSDDTLIVFGGGNLTFADSTFLSASVINTLDGAAWVNVTAHLTGPARAGYVETTLPMYGTL